MVHYPRFGSVMQAIAIGVVLAGVLIAGFSAYSGYQSSPYMVQAQQADASSSPATAYEELTPSRQAVFDQLVGAGEAERQAAPIGGDDLAFFSNAAVQYQGENYVFEVTYDPGTLTPLTVATGLVIAGLGAGLLLLMWLRDQRSTGQSTLPV